MVECLGCSKPFVPNEAAQSQNYCTKRCQKSAWQKRNRAKITAQNKAWIAANPEKVAAYNKTRRDKYAAAPEESRKKCREYQRAWRRKFSERNKEYHRKYYKNYALRKLQANPWASLLQGAKQRAKKAGVPYTLTARWLKNRWTNRCELTKIEFAPPEKRAGYKNRNFSPSIDRIKPAGGYTPRNCRIVLWAVNGFKRDSSDADMYMIAEALIKNRP